ncbi:YggT family protein [Sphingomicrobium lutaoense]|uniref:YggT family protein n=1 Tax=Sphingomicrobium lutaoense TaxID=515949 RepID=A0A839Z4A2_9SPHN|nr:YggT family protein [Sphingomicrobium lutaoense]MBB3764673.1 YggT family protein [Sphingomicrobium lutaoense]
MIFTIVQIVYILLTVLWWIIIAQVIMSWLIAFNVINTQSNFVRTLGMVLERITAPIYRPIRKIMPDFGGIDLSPMVVLIAIMIIERAILPGILAETGVTVFR